MPPFWNALRAMNHGIRMMVSRLAFDRLDRPDQRFRMIVSSPNRLNRTQFHPNDRGSSIPPDR